MRRLTCSTESPRPSSTGNHVNNVNNVAGVSEHQKIMSIVNLKEKSAGADFIVANGGAPG